MRALGWYNPRWPWMTLNSVIALILLFSPNSITLPANYVTVVEDRLIMSAEYCIPVPVFYFLPKLTHPAARSLCDSWATCCDGYMYKFVLAITLNVKPLMSLMWRHVHASSISLLLPPLPPSRDQLMLTELWVLSTSRSSCDIPLDIYGGSENQTISRVCMCMIA